MKKLFYRLLILIAALYIIDSIIGCVCELLLTHSPDGRYYKTNYSLSECNEDIVIFGSSRAESNYAPFVFEDSLKMATWNAGRGGQTLPFWYAMEQGILNRYTPKIAIVNVECDFLALDIKNGLEHAGFLRPFYDKHPEIHPIINKISKAEKYLLISKTYAYNSTFYYLIRPYLIKGLDGRKEMQGWKTSNKIVKNNIEQCTIINSNYKLNKQTVKLFDKFIKELTNRNCKVYIVISPDYKHLIKNTATIDYCAKIKDTTFLNYGNESYFINNHNFFKDPSHLNINGAIEFSKYVSSEIKRPIP